MRPVHSTDNSVEAAMIEGLLREVGIPVHLSRIPRPWLLPDIAYADLAATYEVIVPDIREAEAREIIAGYLGSLKEAGS